MHQVNTTSGALKRMASLAEPGVLLSFLRVAWRVAAAVRSFFPTTGHTLRDRTLRTPV